MCLRNILRFTLAAAFQETVKLNLPQLQLTAYPKPNPITYPFSKCSHERGPFGHELPPLFERIAAPVSSFRLVASHMGERRLGNLAREICLFAAPIAEARPEAVNRGCPLGRRCRRTKNSGEENQPVIGAPSQRSQNPAVIPTAAGSISIMAAPSAGPSCGCAMGASAKPGSVPSTPYRSSRRREKAAEMRAALADGRDTVL
jgi:hypothetical protein